MKNIILFVFLLFALAIRAQDDDDNVVVDADFDVGDYDDNPPIECGEYEIYSQCNANPTCQRTCETLGDDQIPCVRERSCIAGCICKEDYVRSELRGPCMHNNRCPRVRH